MNWRCRACKGSGLASEESTCARCAGLGEVEALTPEEEAADKAALREQSRQMNRVFSSMLMDAGVHPTQLRRKK